MSTYNSDIPPDATELFVIWPDTGIPPGSEEATWHEQAMQPPGSSIPNEMVRNVVIPTLTMFKPAAGTANGTALIIAPGGAFHFLMMYHEGYDVARRLTERGVTAFVLKYRVQHTPENDADMPAFFEEFGKPPVDQPDEIEVDPPGGYPPIEEARPWAEEDGRQAIRFVRQHAAELGIDPNRIGNRSNCTSSLTAGMALV